MGDHGGRMLPFVRAFTSIVAGLVRVPAVRFGVLSLIGTVIYATVLSTAGYLLGSEWTKVSHGLSILGYALFAIVVIAIIGFVFYRLRQFRRESPAPRPVPRRPVPRRPVLRRPVLRRPVPRRRARRPVPRPKPHSHRADGKNHRSDAEVG